MPRIRFTLWCCAASAALTCAMAPAAELSVEQVRATIRAATATARADLSGKDLSDLDLSGIDFVPPDICLLENIFSIVTRTQHSIRKTE